MKSTKLFFILFILIFSSSAYATDYYFCDTGDDNNPGTQDLPMKSFEKAIDVFNKLLAGGSVNLCRGGVFETSTQQRIASWNCSADRICRFGDYGDTNKSKPLIIADGVTPFNFQDSGDAHADGGYLLERLSLLGKNNASAGIVLFNDVNDFVADDLHIENFGIGFYSAGSNPATINADQSNDRVTFKNSIVANNRLIGWHGGCNDCVIENNTFEKNGTHKVRDHNIYIDSPVKSNDFYNRNIKILNNKLINSTMVDGVCMGVSLVAHGIIKDLVIDGNEIIETKGKVNGNCWGIAVDPGNSLDESFVGLTITNNKLKNVGNTGIGCASCSDVLIENNTIIDEAYVLRYGIAVPNKTEDSHKSSNIKVINNRIALSHPDGKGILMGGENTFLAQGNVVSIADYTQNAKCFYLTGANLDTDISLNKCLTHSSVSYDQLVIDDSLELVDEALDSSINNGTDLVEMTEDAKSGETVSSDITPNLTNRYSVTSSQTSSSQERYLTDGSSSSGSTSSGSTSSGSTSSGSTSSGSTSSGSTSSGSTSSGSTSSETDDSRYVSTNTGTESSDTSYRGTSQLNEVELDYQAAGSDSESMSSLNSTGSESSIKSVTVKDVIDASREDNNEVDASTCRAYSRGVCLMR